VRDLAVLFLHSWRRSPDVPVRRRPFGGRRIRESSSATPDPQSVPEAFTESPLTDRIIAGVCVPRAPEPAGPFAIVIEGPHARPPSFAR